MRADFGAFDLGGGSRQWDRLAQNQERARGVQRSRYRPCQPEAARLFTPLSNDSAHQPASGGGRRPAGAPGLPPNVQGGAPPRKQRTFRQAMHEIAAEQAHAGRVRLAVLLVRRALA